MSGDIANIWSANPSLQQIDEELVPRGRGVLPVMPLAERGSARKGHLFQTSGI